MLNAITVYQVISAQQLPKVNESKHSVVDPLVQVQIYGVPADTTMKQTQYIENNGIIFCRLLNSQHA